MILKNIDSKFKKEKSKISAMTINADVVAVNTEYGHFEIADNVGITKQIQVDKYIITIMGGIITDVKEIS